MVIDDNNNNTNNNNYYYYLLLLLYIYIAFLEETVHILSPSQVVIMWFYILDSWTIFK